MPLLLWSVESRVKLADGFEQVTGHLGTEKREP